MITGYLFEHIHKNDQARDGVDPAADDQLAARQMVPQRPSTTRAPYRRPRRLEVKHSLSQTVAAHRVPRKSADDTGPLPQPGDRVEVEDGRLGRIIALAGRRVGEGGRAVLLSVLRKGGVLIRAPVLG
jgi:hypothetical protein